MSWKQIIGGLAVVAMTAAATPAGAAPPANDDIADAVDLLEGVEQRFNTVDATLQSSEVVCSHPGHSTGNTVWFSFTAPSAGEYAAYVTGSDYDTELGWNNTLSNSTGACNRFSSEYSDPVEEQRTFAEGEQEYVHVGAYTAEITGSGSVGVTQVIPAVDDFASATSLSLRSGASTAVIGIEFAGTETTQPGEPTDCGSSTLDGDSAWLEFIAPASGSWMFEAKSTDLVDLAVYEGASVNALTLLNCGTAGRRAVIADVTAGAAYRIRVGGHGATEPVIVRAEPAPTPMTATLVDLDGDGTSTHLGAHSDMVTIDGQPAVAYSDFTNGELRFASRADNGTWTDTLIDADGDGTSTSVGRWPSMAVLPDGQPAVAYYDSTYGALRFASRADNGTWTDTLIDADGDGTSIWVGQSPSMIVQANGQPAVAYHDFTNRELRFASRANNGTWTDTLIDADGNGTSNRVGENPGLVQLANGDLGVGYLDIQKAEIRFARRVGSSWTDQTVWADPEGRSAHAGGTVLDRAGNPVISATHGGNHLLAWWNGSSWDIERDLADRHVSESGCGDYGSEIMIDEADTVHLLWADCGVAASGAMSVRQPDGTWTAHDLTAYLFDLASPDFGGPNEIWDKVQFGATWLPDGRLSVTLWNLRRSSLWYAEEALVAEAGPAAGSAVSTIAVLDGTGSSDAWGAIASYEWSGAPAGCTLTGATTATASISCTADTTGTLALTVTDTDGFTHADTTDFQVAGTVVPDPDPTCGTSPDPFTDVPASSFARADVTCIYNLGVTAGTSPTTYSPAVDATRDQMATFLARLYKSMTGADARIVATPFTDVPDSSFAKDSIARIYGLGITTGTTPTTYSPDDVVTREQMAAFLARFYEAVEDAEGAEASIVATPFTDVPDSSFAKDSIARIYGLGITTGTTPTTYSPDDVVTREQMAAFLARLFRVG